MHARLTPVRHVFRYPVFFFGFDLAELPELNRRSALIGYNRKRLLSIHDRDYLDRGDGPLRERLLRFLETNGYGTAFDRIELFTCPRYFNYVFNPVSFYCCYRQDGSLGCLVAEVNNTFNERHLYIMNPSGTDRNAVRFAAGKDFHVSPFNNMDGHYEFQVLRSEDRVDFRIDLLRDGQPVIKTQLAGAPLPLTTGNILRTLLRQPIAAAMTFPRIMFESFRLFFLKRLRIYTKPAPRSAMTIRVARPTWGQRLGMKLVYSYLERIEKGGMTITLPDKSVNRFGDAASPLQATLQIRDYRFFWRILLHGDIGLGESFTAGEWDTDNLTTIMQLLIENRQVFDDGNLQSAKLGRLVNRLLHILRPNTVRGSRKNITAHYDLGNDFYRAFLDASMVYSCALYNAPDESLDQAQRNKLHALIRKAQIGPDDHVLEIGSGWGAFAVEAARLTNCRVTTITISQQQQALAQQRVRDAGLEDRVRVELCDYRRITGQYDKIISIEMIEAVGHRYLEEFFRVCDRALKPGGLIVLQAITIPHQRYEAYRKGVDWIQKHIFPGGHLPSVDALRSAMKKSSRFVIEQMDHIGIHYARTLRDWHDRFLQAESDVRTMGFDEAFIRKWRYYLSYCEAAFATRTLDTMHLVLSRQEGAAVRSRD